MADWKDQLQKLKENQMGNVHKNRGGPSMTGSYFHDEKGIIKSELLESKAEQWALSFIRPKSGDPELKASQLRKFYNDAKALKTKLAAQKDFSRIYPMIKMIKSKAAYSCPEKGSKNSRKIPTEFKDYIYEMIDHIENEKDFEAFLLCFEAVVGYFYGKGGRQQ